ncbi:MAG: DNA-binding transcriptional regulator LsrR (DeoR family) [Urechidicola sp.]|jgi:DNA-binding transcriptional regulator LsrR (DeoR family)
MNAKYSNQHVDTEQLDLATRAAWLSFIGGYTQGEVATRLDVSPIKAHRLIQLAQQKGMVKIFIEGEPARCVELEEQLTKKFSLRSCLIAPSSIGSASTRPSTNASSSHINADVNEASFNEVGAGAARFFYNILNQLPKSSCIGIGKGRSLSALASKLPKINRADLTFASVSGSFTRKFSANRLDVVQQFVERTGGEGYFMPVPYLARDDEEHEMLMAQASVQFSLNLARNANLYAVGVGGLKTNHYLHSVGLVTDNDLEQLRAAGAVCDLIGSFYDIMGKLVDHPLNGHGLGIKAAEMAGKRVIAVAGGLDKEQALLGALRSGLVTDLVMDEMTAEKMVSLVELK